MPPKKSTTAVKKDPEHPSYKDMITIAISTVIPPLPAAAVSSSVETFMLLQHFFFILHPPFLIHWLFIKCWANLFSSKNVTVHLVKLSKNTSKATTKHPAPTLTVRYAPQSPLTTIITPHPFFVGNVIADVSSSKPPSSEDSSLVYSQLQLVTLVA
jgi:hypothetical protein